MTMQETLNTLEKWISVHTKLLNYFQPVNLGFIDNLLNSRWQQFSFRTDNFDFSAPNGAFFIHWLALRTNFPGKRITIAQFLKSQAHRLGLSVHENTLLEHLLKARWCFYQIVKINKDEFNYLAKNIISGEEFIITGKKAVLIYEPGMVIFSMFISIDGVTFSVGSLESAFKECVIPSIRYFIGTTNKDSKPSTKTENTMRQLAFDFFKIGGIIGFSGDKSKNSNVRTIYDIEKAAIRMKREAPDQLASLSQSKVLDLATDLVCDLILHDQEFSIMRKSLKNLAKIPEHRAFILEIAKTLSTKEVIGNHNLLFATRFAASAFEN